MKPILPTLKEKKRYVMYTVESEKAVKAQAIISEIQKILGVFDSATAGINHITYKKNKGVMRVSLKGLPKVRAAITLIKEITGTPVRISIHKVTGILNKTEGFMEV